MKTPIEVIDSKATRYNQCRKRRRRVIRALRKVRAGAHAPKWSDDAMPAYGMDAERWIQTYELRLMEVNGNIHEIESDPDFFQIQTRALGYRIAPWVFVPLFAVVAGTLVWGVVHLAMAVWF